MEVWKLLTKYFISDEAAQLLHSAGKQYRHTSTFNMTKQAGKHASAGTRKSVLLLKKGGNVKYKEVRDLTGVHPYYCCKGFWGQQSLSFLYQRSLEMIFFIKKTRDSGPFAHPTIWSQHSQCSAHSQQNGIGSASHVKLFLQTPPSSPPESSCCTWQGPRGPWWLTGNITGHHDMSRRPCHCRSNSLLI